MGVMLEAILGDRDRGFAVSGEIRPKSASVGEWAPPSPANLSSVSTRVCDLH